MRPTRVLMVTGEYPPDSGGVADYTRILSKELADAGVVVQILTTQRHLSNSVESDGRERFPVHRIATSWGLSSAPRLASAIAALPIDVVHIQYQTAAYGMGPAINVLPFLLRRRCRTVVTMHDLRVPYLFPKAGQLRMLANRLLVATADAAIVTNPEDLEVASAWRRTNLYSIPIGSNIPVAPPRDFNRDQVRQRLDVQQGDLLLGYFGMLNESKGVETLLEAVALVRGQGLPVKLVLIGDALGVADATNVASSQRIDARIKELGLGECVKRTGALPPDLVSAHLLSLDLCVLPYRDGASFRRGSLMAALVHGLPIVTTALPGGRSPALVPDQEAILVAPDDPQALAAMVTRANDDPALRERIAAGAKQRARQFEWPAIARATFEVYRSVLTNRIRDHSRL